MALQIFPTLTVTVVAATNQRLITNEKKRYFPLPQLIFNQYKVRVDHHLDDARNPAR
jgi:hypothetical protein